MHTLLKALRVPEQRTKSFATAPVILTILFLFLLVGFSSVVTPLLPEPFGNTIISSSPVQSRSKHIPVTSQRAKFYKPLAEDGVDLP